MESNEIEIQPQDLTAYAAVQCLRRELDYTGPVKSNINTWLGARAQVELHWKNSNDRNGERVIRTTWIDDAAPANGGHPAGTVTIGVIRGNPNTYEVEYLVERVVLTDAHPTWLAAELVDDLWQQIQEELPDRADEIETDRAWQAQRDLASLVRLGYIRELPKLTRDLMFATAREMQTFVAERS